MIVSTQSATASSLPSPSSLLDTSSTIILSTKSLDDPFALPSYSEATKNKAIEIDLETLNKATLSKADAKRYDINVDKESKDRSTAVKKEEDEEEARLERMRQYAKQERLASIEREKAETKANRWNTF